MINFAICDDSMEHINILENYLYKIGKTKLTCDVYQSGEEFLLAYKNNNRQYDVIFLDMEMKQLNGIETGNQIREYDEHVIIIFVTSYKEYMQKSFECAPFRFLLKPINFEELKEVFDKLCQKLSKQRKVFNFIENKSRVRLFCDDIIYFESQGHWILIYTKDSIHKICKSMNDLYAQLDPEIFFRVHKSFIINFHYVKRIKGNTTNLYYCDKLIPISRSYKKVVIKQFTEFVEKEYYV